MRSQGCHKDEVGLATLSFWKVAGFEIVVSVSFMCIYIYIYMLGPSCQRYNWQAGRCGSIAFGSSPRRGKTDFKPLQSYGSIHLWKTSGDNLKEKSGVEPLKAV